MANDCHKRAEGGKGREAWRGWILLPRVPPNPWKPQQEMPLKTALVSNPGTFLGPTPRDNLCDQDRRGWDYMPPSLN